MRISGGSSKGRRTGNGLLSKTSRRDRLRPTSSKVREALFDILSKKIEGASFVDLYAGSGTVGLEALSRGAGGAVFVEERADRVRAVKEFCERLGFGEKAEVVRGKAEAFLKRAHSKKLSFDIFFVDPPYQSDEIGKILPMIDECRLLNEGGLVVVEHFSRKQVPERSAGLSMIRHYRYGDTILTLYGKAST
jgi:16S rRNA (guanine966-N2)-methyltransferase